MYDFWPTVCKTVRPILSHRCLSVCPVLSMSVCLWRWCIVAKTVGWIKMKLGIQVGLGTGHILLDGDTALPTERGTAAPHLRNLRTQTRPYKPRPMSMPNRWMDQDATWYGGRLGPGHIVRWGPSSPFPKVHSPNFRPISTVAKRSPISATAEHLSMFIYKRT